MSLGQPGKEDCDIIGCCTLAHGQFRKATWTLDTKACCPACLMPAESDAHMPASATLDRAQGSASAVLMLHQSCLLQACHIRLKKHMQPRPNIYSSPVSIRECAVHMSV